MKRTPFKRKTTLRIKGVSTTTELRDEIQSLLREIGLIRDGGCIFRNFKETGQCGGRRKDGELILQFDHLNSRTHAVSFADTRLGVIACKRHHLYYKKQYPAQYEHFARLAIGEKRCALLDRVREDKTAHRQDLKLDLLALKQELAKLKTASTKRY